jgi:pimeloyl-ACP methyl ester carboxylesterase
MQHVTRRQLILGLGAVVASTTLPRTSEAQNATNAIGPYSADVLPRGIRSRFVDNVNGLRMHVLEAGYEPKGRPGVLLLHGFPELAFSWRKVMGPIAAAGFHVMAPDVRGYGRTSGTDVQYDDDLAPFRSLNQVRDMLGLVSAFGHRAVDAVIGHDQGSPLAGWCALVRPDVFRSVTMMSAPFTGPPAIPFDTADAPAVAAAPPADTIYDELAKLNPPRKHYQRYYTTREANENMWHASQGIHAFLRAYYHMKSADWTQNQAAALLRDGSRQGDGRDRRAGDAVSRRDCRQQVAAGCRAEGL